MAPHLHLSPLLATESSGFSQFSTGCSWVQSSWRLWGIPSWSCKQAPCSPFGLTSHRVPRPSWADSRARLGPPPGRGLIRQLPCGLAHCVRGVLGHAWLPSWLLGCRDHPGREPSVLRPLAPKGLSPGPGLRFRVPLCLHSSSTQGQSPWVAHQRKSPWLGGSPLQWTDTRGVLWRTGQNKPSPEPTRLVTGFRCPHHSFWAGLGSAAPRDDKRACRTKLAHCLFV